MGYRGQIMGLQILEQVYNTRLVPPILESKISIQILCSSLIKKFNQKDIILNKRNVRRDVFQKFVAFDCT